MNRAELAAAARRRRVRPDSYTFDPAAPGEHYVLTVGRGGWSVYYSEHGHARDVERFDTEDEACRRLLARLEADPSTRASRSRRTEPTSPKPVGPPERVETWQLVAAVVVLVALAWGWAAAQDDGGAPSAPPPAVSGR